MIIIVAVIIIFALIFDYLNGFHDAANILATTVSTRALSPKKALILGVTFQFIGAVSVVSITMHFADIPFFKPVSDTIGKIVALPHIEDVLESGQIFSLEFLALIISIGLISTIIWNIVTWFFGIPSSSSHALIGGICGAAFMAFGISVIKFNIILLAVLSLYFPTLQTAFFQIYETVMYAKSKSLVRNQHTICHSIKSAISAVEQYSHFSAYCNSCSVFVDEIYILSC